MCKCTFLFLINYRSLSPRFLWGTGFVVQQEVAVAESNTRRICDLQEDVQACLALSRAMLQALAAMSPMVAASADIALEEESDRQDLPERTAEIIEQARQGLSCSPAEARRTRLLERALIGAADAIADDQAPLRRRA